MWRLLPRLTRRRAFSSGDAPNVVAPTPRATLSREARKLNRIAKTGASEGSSSSTSLWASVGAGTALVSGLTWSLMANPDEFEFVRPVQESTPGAWVIANVTDVCTPFIQPSRDKLIPDWSMVYPGMSPDTPPPHTLVIDLEETLIRAVWDRRHGWRHAKRPGADAFLREMSKYYEIVIFTSSTPSVIVENVIMSLDKDNLVPHTHKLFRDATRFHRGYHCKDIALLNRDPRKIVVLDDDALAVQLQPENAILIKPYTDVTDRADSELDDITPFLCALVHEGVRDVPAALAKFSDRHVSTIALEYGQLLTETKQKSTTVKSFGLGGFVRSSSSVPEPLGGAASGAITAADIVGDAPEPEAPKKGRFFQYISDRSKQDEENQKLKLEAWNKHMIKKDQQRRAEKQDSE